MEQGYDSAYQRDGALIDQLMDPLKPQACVPNRAPDRRRGDPGVRHAPRRSRPSFEKLVEAGLIEHFGRGHYALLNPLLRRRLVEQRGFEGGWS